MQITEDRRKRVIDLYFNQHKSYAEVAQIMKMSPRDIHTIVKEEKAGRLQNEHQQQQQEISSKAYKLFSKGKKPVEVAIELSLREPEATRLFIEYCKLKRLNILISIYKETDGDLHFTLTLDSAYATYSDRNDCNPPITGCKNIIVEVICHNTPVTSYDQYGKYCDGVKPVYTHGQFPKQGDRLIVEGKFVVDENEHWNEIHPASYVKCIHTDCK